MRARVTIIIVTAALVLAAPRARGDEPAAANQPANAAQPAPTAGGAPSAQATPQAQTGGRPQPAKPQEQKLTTVVVTATRIEEPLANVGTSVTVVEDQAIEQQKIETVGSVLREVPGVQVTQSGSPGTLSDVSIRGSTPAQTLILIDGVEVNTGGSGEFDIADLTTDNLDRVEVLRGAGGSLYGSQAIGGVVNLITPEGEGPPHFSLLSEGGNRATERQVMEFGGADGRLSYSGAVSYYSTQGFRPVNDNSDNLSGSFRLDYHLDDDTTLRGFARYIRSNVSLVNFSAFSGFPINPTAHQRGEFMLYRGEIERRFGERLVVRLDGSFVRDDIRLNATPYAGNPSSEVDRIPDEIRGANLEAVYTWESGWRTLVGFDFKDRWVRSSSVSSFPPFGTFSSLFHARRQEYAGYAEQEGSLLDGHVLMTGGFRVDGNSEFGKEVSPAWSVAIPIHQIATTLRASYAEGFRAPSFDELFFPGFGNPNLGPEISSEYDGGFTTNFGELASLSANYFSRRVHHLIVAVPCPTCLFGSEAGNAGRVDTQGVEIIPSVTFVKGLTLSGAITYLDETHVSSSPTIRPLRVPKYSAWSLLQYVRSNLLRPHDQAIASFRYIFVGDRDDITTASTIQNHAAYHRFDAVASYALGWPVHAISNEEIFARISNLLDRHYSEAFGFPSPPVNFVAGVKLDFE